MSYRGRKIVATVVLVIVASAYGRISRDWSFGTFYPVFLGLVAVMAPILIVWTEVGPGEKPHHKSRH